MMYTWNQNKIKTKEYTKYICEGYLVEVIPDITDSDKTVFMVHVRSLCKTASEVSNVVDFVESAHMKIDVSKLRVDDDDPIYTTYKNVALNVVFNVEFIGTSWKNGVCTKGLLRVTAGTDM